MAKDALWLGAFLEGCKTVLQAGLSLDDNSVMRRDGGDGAPRGAYRGTKWFVGVYLGGATWGGGSSQETFSLNLAVGVDVTRIWSVGTTKQEAENAVRQGEFLSKIARTCELLMQGKSAVARACQSAYDSMMGGVANRDALYREHFDRPNIMTPRSEGPEWIAAVPNENTAPETIFVCSLTFSGLKLHKYLSEIEE